MDFLNILWSHSLCSALLYEWLHLKTNLAIIYYIYDQLFKYRCLYYYIYIVNGFEENKISYLILPFMKYDINIRTPRQKMCLHQEFQSICGSVAQWIVHSALNLRALNPRICCLFTVKPPPFVGRINLQAMVYVCPRPKSQIRNYI